MIKKITLKKLFWSIISLFITGIGIAFSTRPGLGTSPIASPSYAMTFVLPLTLGTWTIITNAFMVFAQIIILKKEFDYFQLTQLITVSFLGLFIDIGMWVSGFFIFQNYFALLAEQIFGCFVLALGISIELAANLFYLPGEGMVNSIVQRWNLNFGKVKIAFDCTMVVTAILITLIFTGKIQGVREGTIIAAFGVGFMIKLLEKPLSHLKKYIRKGTDNE